MTAFLALATVTAAATFTALSWDLGWRLHLHHLDDPERTDR